jgi:hypothetical protein
VDRVTQEAMGLEAEAARLLLQLAVAACRASAALRMHDLIQLDITRSVLARGSIHFPNPRKN